MPQRALWIGSVLLGIVGLAVAAWLVAGGKDLAGSAATGPRWRRRMLLAVIALLSALGITAVGRAEPAAPSPATKPDPATANAPAPEPQDTPQWQTILAAWKEVAPLAQSGQSTRAQRKSAEDKLAAAGAAVAQLAAAGSLSASEAALLNDEAGRLRTEMLRNPPTDNLVPCYEAMGVAPLGPNLARLKRCLPLLKELVTAGKVKPGVLEKVLPTIQGDVALLNNETELAKLTPAGRQDAAELRAQVQAQLQQVEALRAKAKTPASAPAAP